MCDEIKHITAELSGEPLPVNEPPKPRSRKKVPPVVARVTDADGQSVIVRTHTLSEERRYLKTDNCYRFSADELETTFITTGPGIFMKLSQYIIEADYPTGVIARLDQVSFDRGLTRRKSAQEDHYVRFDGTNYQLIQNFVAPYQTNKTRKGNKLNVATPQGSFSVADGDYIVKLPTGHLLKFTDSEFHELYDTLGWKAQ
ncbi:hypothetical protein [uncultured Secundilactobacillus sp.]|uniref:hypothetical protein n=1 Tax=uncultured Secundilactobacillus sp. TaxID=2813935 RepID=UPI0025906787|nr:hypothetical protein [uncultured Secundilactobacillus sp.]